MWKLAGQFSTIGIEMAGAMAIGVMGGQWLDERYGTSPYLFWFGTAVGMGAALRAVQRATRMAKRVNVEDTQQSPDT
jgi:F0F1-type ATP synthase assembly protein I